MLIAGHRAIQIPIPISQLLIRLELEPLRRRQELNDLCEFHRVRVHHRELDHPSSRVEEVLPGFDIELFRHFPFFRPATIIPVWSTVPRLPKFLSQLLSSGLVRNSLCDN